MAQRHLPKLLATLVLLLIGVLLLNRQFAQQFPNSPTVPSGTLRTATAAERQAAIGSITNQLIAFKKDDFKTATSYQSAALKRNFRSVEAFRAMMKKNYPQFTNYKSVTFGPAQADAKGQSVLIPVELTGQDGVQIKARYFMVMENKAFRVAGVDGGQPRQPLPSHPVKAPSPPPVSA